MFLLLVSGIYGLVSVYDVCFRKIPDTFPLLLSVLGLGILIISGDLLSALTTTGLAAATFLVLAMLCIAGKIGGGDVKLIAASVLLVGAGSFLDFLVLTALLGGLLSLVYLASSLILRAFVRISEPTLKSYRYKRESKILSRIWQAERRRILRLSSIPYGVAISAGGLLALTLTSF